MIENKNSVVKRKLIIPTLLATILASIPSAFAAEGSAVLTQTLTHIASFINIGISDLTHCAVYNFIFPFIFGWMNRGHYSKNGKFDYASLSSDLIFKIIPVGWTISIILFHIPRNIVMYWLIKENHSLWISSIFSDVIVTIFYIPFRFYGLKYYEISIKYIKEKVLWS